MMTGDILDSELKSHTSSDWIPVVLENFPLFLADHASNERKAAAAAMDFVVRYPNHVGLVETASKIAQQEIAHFRQVFHRMKINGFALTPDEKSQYMDFLLSNVRNGSKERLLDRILLAAVVEMRGGERFELLSRHHPEEAWRFFYKDLYEGEKDHFGGYLEQALIIFPSTEVSSRWEEVLSLEAKAMQISPISYKLFP